MDIRLCHKSIKFRSRSEAMEAVESGLPTHNIHQNFPHIYPIQLSAKQQADGFILSNNNSPSIQISSAKQVNGVPVYRFRKEVIKTGDYYKASDDLAFTVTDEVLQHWADTWVKWNNNGNKVAVPETHDGAQEPAKNRGWVVDIFKEGSSLIAIMDLYGEDAPKIANTNDVSIYSPMSITDGKGIEYSRPITHIALCTDPVIPGLSPFEVVAASLKSNNPIKNKEYSMSKYVKLAKGLGLSFKDEDEKEQKKQIMAALKAVKASMKDMDDDEIKAAFGYDDDKKETKASKDDEKNVEAAKDDDEIKASMGNGQTRPPTMTNSIQNQLVGLSLENRAVKIDHLFQTGKISSNVYDDMKTKYLNRETLSLSLSNGTDDGFNTLVETLSKNNLVELGEKTNAQHQSLVLGDMLKNGKNPLLEDAEKRAENNK